MTMGEFTQNATITAWEPNKRLAYRGDEGPDGSVHAFEYLVEGREGGSTVLRLVHSGFMGDDWEAEYEALQKGWGMYLDKLAEYFTYFRGRHATPIWAMVPPSEGEGDVVRRLQEGLGLKETPKVGDRVHLTPENLPPIDGVVDYVRGDFLGVRTDDAMYRFIRGYIGRRGPRPQPVRGRRRPCGDRAGVAGLADEAVRLEVSRLRGGRMPRNSQSPPNAVETTSSDSDGWAPDVVAHAPARRRSGW